MAFRAMARHSSMVPFPARKSIAEASSRHTKVRSSGPLPLRVSTASATSREFPTAYPRGISISVIRAQHRLPALVPMATIFSANRMESSRVFINAPLPVFTSSTIPQLPAAIFLLIMEAAMRGTLSMVAVTSRSAYSFLSAGTILPDCPITAILQRFTIS